MKAKQDLFSIKSDSRESSKTRSLKELVPSALKAIEKSAQRDLPYDRVPIELLWGDKLDLPQWSLVLTDACLSEIKAAHQPSTDHEEDASGVASSKLILLNIAGAQKVTDVGLQSLAPCCLALQSLYLDNLYLITGDGLVAITKRCSNLRQLSLSGCMGISGAAFGIIGQANRNLTTLKLSGCRQVNPWALMKIFESCTMLKSLDISFCSLVTDEQIKLLSENCPDLRQLNLRDCKQISDVGLSFISQGCPMLSEINLRRSEMPFRISDVALLQLGQGCQHLLSLNLHGCEMVSDTGISWLASWSKELRHLDLTNCTKITNKGIRHIGEGCQKLKSIILLNLKKVSDVGVRCLANGCPALESLNASGLVMLSDGVDRSFGLEGLQALGKSKCSVFMKHLALHGCNQISTISLKAISNFINLEFLDLSNCSKLTLDGIARIGKSCRRLTQVSLASCGDCVNFAVVEALFVYSELVATVNLSFCPRVGEQSLKALSNCTKLQSLNLSGCISVTDQAILRLCDGEFNPGLRHLFLDGCQKVTDTSLSWITDGLRYADGSLTLETLSLKGTSVTKAASKGICDRLPFSVLKNNSSFFGYWPASRSDDRKVISAYHKRACCATSVQALYRSRREKDTLAYAKEEYCKKRVAIWAGARYRGGRARRVFKEMKRERKEQLSSSLALQCAFRLHVARKKADRMREKRWAIVTPYASTIIQRHWRGVLGRRKASKARAELLRELQLFLKATMRIQNWFRRILAKRLLVLLRCRWFTHELDRFRSSIKIQSCYRMRLAKKQLQMLKHEFEELEKLMQASVSRISMLFRCRLFKKAIQERIMRTQQRLEAAMLLQQWYRSETERVRQKLLAEKKLAEQRVKSAKLIQRTVRKRLAYMTLVKLRLQREELEALRESKATVLCSWGRICAAKLRVRQRRMEFEEEMKRALVLKIWAATAIASGWRGKMGRDRARSCRLIRDQRWKALFDPGSQLTFYYNQDTGETRWSKPQVLLDLEPKPVCSNCDEYQAEVECRDCEEFYCTSCWGFIHMGGKRAFHSYRTMYDYYGKRLDYDREPWIVPFLQTNSEENENEPTGGSSEN